MKKGSKTSKPKIHEEESDDEVPEIHIRKTSKKKYKVEETEDVDDEEIIPPRKNRFKNNNKIPKNTKPKVDEDVKKENEIPKNKSKKKEKVPPKCDEDSKNESQKEEKSEKEDDKKEDAKTENESQEEDFSVQCNAQTVRGFTCKLRRTYRSKYCARHNTEWTKKDSEGTNTYKVPKNNEEDIPKRTYKPRFNTFNSEEFTSNSEPEEKSESIRIDSMSQFSSAINNHMGSNGLKLELDPSIVFHIRYILSFLLRIFNRMPSVLSLMVYDHSKQSNTANELLVHENRNLKLEIDQIKEKLRNVNNVTDKSLTDENNNLRKENDKIKGDYESVNRELEQAHRIIKTRSSLRSATSTEPPKTYPSSWFNS